MIAILCAQLLQVSVASVLRKRTKRSVSESSSLLSHNHNEHENGTRYVTTSIDSHGKAPTAIVSEPLASHDHGHDDSEHSHSLLFDDTIEKHVATYILELGIASHR